MGTGDTFTGRKESGGTGRGEIDYSSSPSADDDDR
jgi:hypothetical protein